jgi:hypothetical protein
MDSYHLIILKYWNHILAGSFYSTEVKLLQGPDNMKGMDLKKIHMSVAYHSISTSPSSFVKWWNTKSFITVIKEAMLEG